MYYGVNDFIHIKLLSNTIRMKLGFFIIDGLQIFSFAYGHPNRNDDYFEYSQISESEYRQLLDQDVKYKDEDFKFMYHKYITSKKVLCNDYPKSSEYYKPYFVINEVDMSKCYIQLQENRGSYETL